MTLPEALKSAGIGYRLLAKELGIGKSTLGRIAARGWYPQRFDIEDFTTRLHATLKRHGVVHADDVELPTPIDRTRKTTPKKEEVEEVPMQIDRDTLSHFGLKRNPFLNDIETDADVFAWPGHKKILQTLRDGIEERAFVSLIGPSGAGKTTIIDTLEAEMLERGDTIICRPQVMAKDRLLPDHLVTALLASILGDEAHIYVDRERRGRQLSRALIQQYNGTQQRRVVLLIDDAHYCQSGMLRQLKTFYEQKIGRTRLMSIILVGLPELRQKLQLFQEIGNRSYMAEIGPVPLRAYLDHKLSRVGADVSSLFDGPGFEAFAERFRGARRTALGHPQLINAQTIRAMAKLMESEPKPGEKISAAVIDRMPGAQAAIRLTKTA
jgi:type II secretory pathway predicted ATPase ExeA